MRRLPRPRSQGFRAMLGMALLAWAMLASGALAGPLHGLVAAEMAGTTQMTAVHTATAHCDGMAASQADADHAPAMPAGHGCCQGGCHCMSTCSVGLSVPPTSAVAFFPQARPSAVTSAAPAQKPAAPPLRPPIA